MANRYWVGGTAVWDGTAGTKWATTSGGVGGASVPTFVDDVFFDNLSTGLCTISGGVRIAKSINCTGFTGAWGGSADLNVDGSLTLFAGMTYAHAGIITISGTGVVTTAGKPLALEIFGSPGDTITLADDLLASGKTLFVTRGTFDAANFNVSIQKFNSSDDSYSRTVNMGSGTWTITGSFGTVWDTGIATQLTVNPGASTISLTGLGIAVSIVFAGGGKNYYNLNVGGSGFGQITILGSNAFNNITNTAQPIVIRFNGGSTQTVSNFGLSGVASSPVTIRSNNPGVQFNLSKSSGTVNAQYLSIQDSNATGGANWNAVASQNLGNNTGWFFSGGNAFLTFM